MFMSSVGIATGWTIWVRLPAGASNFSFSIQYPASYSMGIGGSFPGGKAAGSWSWPLTSI